MKKQKPDVDADDEAAELDKLLAVLAPPGVPVDSKISATVKLQAILKKRRGD